MASIRKNQRKDGTTVWAVLWRENGKQTSRTFPTEYDARMLKDFLDANGNSFELAAQAAARLQSTKPTVDTIIRRHIDSLTSITNGTRLKYGRIYEQHIMAPLGSIPIDALSRTDVTRWFNRLGRAEKTKRNIHSLLSSALAAAVKEGIIDSNPAVGIRGERELSSVQAVFLSREQFLLITSHIREEFSLFVRFLEATGLRFGEATALRWQDIDLRSERGVVHVSRAVRRGERGVTIGVPKTRSSVRSVSLPLWLGDELREVREGHGPGELVFQSPGGLVLTNGYFHRRAWIPLMNQIGAELGCRPRVHDLRHTHASRLIEAGVPLPVIQRRLGHESITTTVGTYGHLSIDADSKAASVLD